LISSYAPNITGKITSDNPNSSGFPVVEVDCPCCGETGQGGPLPL
jgi:hypothetical protein